MLTSETAREPIGPATETTLLDLLSSEPQNWALFLDIDGTLIDLAETPEGVIVPEGLTDVLEQLSQRLNGALGLVTGRAVSFTDTLFAPLSLPVAGLHGAERRKSTGELDRLPEDESFATLKRSLARVTTDWNGVIIEDKGSAVAAHYRQAPQWQASLETLMASALEATLAAGSTTKSSLVEPIGAILALAEPEPLARAS